MAKKKVEEGPTPAEVVQATWATLEQDIKDKGLSAQIGQRILREMAAAVDAL